MKKLIYLICTVSLCCSCNDFLEKKPDVHMVIPKSLNDVTLLLNDYSSMSSGFPIYGELGTDDYTVSQPNWEAASSLDQRNAYIWIDAPYNDAVQWQRPYKTVYIANQALEILAKLDSNENSTDYNRNLGASYFYRAFAFHLLSEIFCPAYQDVTADTELGIPLRLTAAIDMVSSRSTLKDTYSQILKDFKAAALYLPERESVKGRPFKASAYAGLARTYLYMQDFERAYLYADSCLQLNPDLIDYNILKASDALPVPRFNTEVLYSALSVNAGIMGLNIALVDAALYDSYSINDLRKGIFFKPGTSPNTFLYKGNYDKNSSNLFMGITTSEVYLIKAEAACRIGKTAEALEAINTLLKSRWNKDVVFTPIDEANPDLLLKKILEERRKELLFRGRRWSDLKRLNLDSRFQKVLTRDIAGKVYSLAPNADQYAYRIPEAVINLSGISQNKR